MTAIKQAITIIFVLVVFFIAQIICSSLKSDTNAEYNQNYMLGNNRIRHFVPVGIING